MQKVYIILFFSLSVFCLSKCKPAAEDRVKMHQNAKRISDSIGKSIDDAMNDVQIDPPQTTPVPVPVDPSKK